MRAGLKAGGAPDASDVHSDAARAVLGLAGGRALAAAVEHAERAGWPAVHAAAGRRLWPLLSHRCRAGGVDVPTPVRAAWDDAHRANTLAWMRRRQLLRDLVAHLTRAGCAVTVLKGMAVAPTVWPTPVTRTMSDMDLWVHAPDVEPIPALAAPLGWRVAHFQDLGYADRARVVPLAWGDPPLVLEALAAPGSLVEAVPALLDTLASRTVPGDDWPMLAPGDQLLHAIVHAALHHRYTGVLPGLLDVAFILERHGAGLDWAAWGDMLRAQGMATVAASALAASAALVEAPVPAAAWDGLGVAPSTAMALGREASAIAWWAHVTGENPSAAIAQADGGASARAVWQRLARYVHDPSGERPGGMGRLGRRLWRLVRFIVPSHLARLARGEHAGETGAARRALASRHAALMRALGAPER